MLSHIDQSEAVFVMLSDVDLSDTVLVMLSDIDESLAGVCGAE